MPTYRPNVAFILRNRAGEILLGERSDWAGCWQFPQGGVKAGETWDEALAREVEEELGLPPSAYRVVAQRGPYRYLFDGERKRPGFDGQEQHYFLGEWAGAEQAVRVEADGEFRAVRWIRPAAFRLSWIPEMKRPVYRQVFAEFFDCPLDAVTVSH
jgi:putative (di)nucleoside polyphosphate hydrolase